MSLFTITTDTNTFGFGRHIYLDIANPIDFQLGRHRLSIADIPLSSNELKRVIDKNSSLRIYFGWSFEAAYQYEEMMNECLTTLAPKYSIDIIKMTTDMRCDWLGFMPFNVFERTVYEDLSHHGLIIFNNDLIDFQIAVVEFISKNKWFLQHSITRNKEYRFNEFKLARNNPDKLYELFHYIITSLQNISKLEGVSRQYIEELIGCHYLYHPDIFFELLEFYKLKGQIYE